MTTIAFFYTEDWEKERIQASALAKEAELTFVKGPLDAEHIPEKTDAEIVSVFVDAHIDASVLEKFPTLKHIAARSTGFDHIDLAAAKARGITVSNVPAYGECTVAEHAFALLLALSKRVYDGFDQIREHNDFDPHKLRGFDLYGKTLGVVGTGRIGRHSVKIGKGFGMKVVCFDTRPDEQFAQQEGITYLPLDDLLAQSDIVTLHVPYMPATHHLINTKNIEDIKKGAVLINTSRGAVVETQALVGALQSGRLGGAGLDVLEEEAPMRDELHFLMSGTTEGHDLKVLLMEHALIDMPNVIITPHSAFNTKEALERILDTTVENILAYIKGAPQNLVS
jgi:D-lactate dehydrogenase